MFRDIRLKSCIISLLSSMFLAFGFYNVHAVSGVTEGGVLGMTLLLQHWIGVSPAISGFLLDIFCYGMGWKLLGVTFITYSVISSSGFSIMYKICEQFDPLWPQLAEMKFTAALLGAVFVGVGAGICVRLGGAPGGDDALAMSVAHITKWRIEYIYLLTDFIVLLLSVSYIPLRQMGYSVLTVILSGQIIGVVQRIKLPRSGVQTAIDG